MLVSKPSVPEMTFHFARLDDARCKTSCPAWIVADGKITKDTVLEFESFAKKFGKSRLTVVFNSDGGDPVGAMALGRALRANGFDSAVGKTKEAGSILSDGKPVLAALPSGGVCKQACLLAFVGGKERHINPLAKAQIEISIDDMKVLENSGAFGNMKRHLDDLGVSGFFLDEFPVLLNSKSGEPWSDLVFRTHFGTDFLDTAKLLAWDKCYNGAGCEVSAAGL